MYNIIIIYLLLLLLSFVYVIILVFNEAKLSLLYTYSMWKALDQVFNEESLASLNTMRK